MTFYSLLSNHTVGLDGCLQVPSQHLHPRGRLGASHAVLGVALGQLHDAVGQRIQCARHDLGKGGRDVLLLVLGVHQQVLERVGKGLANATQRGHATALLDAHSATTLGGVQRVRAASVVGGLTRLVLALLERDLGSEKSLVGLLNGFG